MSLAETTDKPKTPYDRIGGREQIATMVNRFYDLMDQDTDYSELRAMHAPDLSPMRDSLTDFLMAWMGGPRDWFDQQPGACVMSAHSKLEGMNAQVAEQWISAMTRAARQVLANDAEFAEAMIDALANMSRGMARPKPDGAH